MAYNDKLATRVREIIALTHKRVEEKKMFGGLCFMVNDKMCIGINEDKIMLRVDPDEYDRLMQREDAEPMDFTGRVMHGYIFVNERFLKTKPQLNAWVQRALSFNKKAPATAKQKKQSTKKKGK